MGQDKVRVWDPNTKTKGKKNIFTFINRCKLLYSFDHLENIQVEKEWIPIIDLETWKELMTSKMFELPFAYFVQMLNDSHKSSAQS